MRDIKFRGKRIDINEWVEGYFVMDPKGQYRIYWQPFPRASSNTYHFVKPKTVGQFTGYKMFEKEVYFGDLVSNNYQTDKEVIREIVMHEGSIMMKRVKGKSRLPKYTSLHEWHALNFKIIGTIHDKE